MELNSIHSIYLIGSLRNKYVPFLGNKIRGLGFDVYDSWSAAGPEADDCWQEYAKIRGLTYKEALNDWSAKQVFEMDKRHLDRCDAAILVYPAGKSGHLELGYMAGSGKLTFVLVDQEPERYDVMLNFATEVCLNEQELFDAISARKTIPNSGWQEDRDDYSNIRGLGSR